MRTVRIGARLTPVLGVAHGSNLQSWYSAIHTDRKFGFFSFSKYYRVSTRGWRAYFYYASVRHRLGSRLSGPNARGEMPAVRARELTSPWGTSWIDRWARGTLLRKSPQIDPLLPDPVGG